MLSSGLSPHTRGKLPAPVRLSPSVGPIPAYAGETVGQMCRPPFPRAYPRIRGGNMAVCFSGPCIGGLSPHTRGKHQLRMPYSHAKGPIPAYAGETQCRPPPAHGRRAYPRIRGGNPVDRATGRASWGLSPHTRGKRGVGDFSHPPAGPIPAYAGETWVIRLRTIWQWAYPRIRGGNAGFHSFDYFTGGLSPHTRGKLLAKSFKRFCAGPIPAYAGETICW